MKNLIIISGLVYVLCGISVESAISMENSEEVNQFLGSEQRHITLKSQIPRVKDYIANLDCEPNAVFGVLNTEEGIGRFNKSWIFIDIVLGKKDNRSLILDFNETEELLEFSKAFPNTFRIIAFDAEVPTYLKNFGLHHLNAIHGALRMEGVFYLPWQYAMSADYQNSKKWSEKSPEDAMIAFSIENNMTNRQDLFDPEVRLPEILGAGQNEQLNQKIILEIREKNQVPVLEKIFGKANVEIFKDRKLPFSENQGRLTNPPYVTVFLANKKFPTEQIKIDLQELYISKGASQVIGIEEKDDMPVIKPLSEQIRYIKNNLTPSLSYSMVVLVDEREQPERFDNRWIKIIRPYHTTNDPLALQTTLENISDLKIIAGNFSNTFEHVVFDVETPSLFIDNWTDEHFKYLFKLIKADGKLTLPLHYEWHINQDETYPTLEKTKESILKQVSSDGGVFIFKGLGAPYTFISEMGKNKEAEDIFTRLQFFASNWHNVDSDGYRKAKLSAYGIESIGSNAVLNSELIEVINRNLYDFTSGIKIEPMKNAIEQYYLKAERGDFIKRMNAQVLVPHTISFFENILGKGSCMISYDKKLPFQVVREDMDYVVLTAKKT